MTSTNAFTIRPSNKEGKTDYFVVQQSSGKELEFAGQVPIKFALKHAARIFSCANCMNYTWCGVFISMCANCGLETGAQRGLINYGQEYESHMYSVFAAGQYLENCDLADIGDKNIVNTVGILVGNLYNQLLNKFVDEKKSFIHELCEYLCSLDNEPRVAISRINKVMYSVTEEDLYDKVGWWDNFFKQLECEESSDIYISYDERQRQRENDEIQRQRENDERQRQRENDKRQRVEDEDFSLEYRRREKLKKYTFKKV